MAACKNCGCELPEGAKFCRECGSEVIPEKNQFCSNCGFEMPRGSKFCPECGASTSRAANAGTTNQVRNTNKSSGLAAILSFLIIGLGQIYLGLTKKGILLFIGAVISGVLMFVLIGWITWFIIWIYSIYDAYNSAEKMNQGLAVEDTLDFNNLF